MVTAEHAARLHLRKDNGLVKDVFGAHHMQELRGHVGLAHCRYPTAGTSSCAEAQPLYTNYPYGICVAHNGNLTNTTELTTRLAETVGRHCNTDSDSELLLNMFAEHLTRHHRPAKPAHPPPMHQAVFSAMTAVMQECRGGYAGLYLINGFGLVAFRDPHGIRPLVLGCRKRNMQDGSVDASPIETQELAKLSPTQMSGQKYDFVVSSESVAIDTLGFQLIRYVRFLVYHHLHNTIIMHSLTRSLIHYSPIHHSDVKAGEAIFIDMQGNCHARICHEQGLSPCIFEYVYFARPDSIMDGISVYETRLKMGEKLAQKILRLQPNHDIDVVIPIPDTSRTSALQAAYTLNRPFREGFIKNRYIARTFIMPGQATRKKSVRLKLNTIKSEFAGRNVLLVDDSIVRGTTANEIVQMARDAGARKVYFCSAAPAIRFPNIYGIDIPTRQELIAYERTEAEIAKKIGCDMVVYQDLSDLEDSVREAAAPGTTVNIPKFDTSCFSGIYVTGESIQDAYFDRLHAERNDGAKEQRKRGVDANGDVGTPAKKPMASHDGCESVSNDKRTGKQGVGAGCEPLSNQSIGLVR